MLLGRKAFIKTSAKERDCMSLEKDDQKSDEKGLELIRHWGTTQRIHALVSEPISEAAGDKKKLYKFPVSTGTSIRRKTMVIRQLEYIISRWTGDQFPNVIYLTCEGLNGYLKKDTTGFVSTDRIAALELQEISPVLDDASLRTYDLRYTLKETVSWVIPSTTAELIFGLRIDNETENIDLPLPNPLSLNFELRYELIGPQTPVVP